MRQMKKLMKRLNRNKKGSIEGLPLQLMIIIVIAAMATSVLVGWMGNIEEPQSIGSVESCYDDSSESITVKVYDQDGYPIENATVSITGLGITSDKNKPVGTTNANGTVVFENIHFKMNQPVGQATVDVFTENHGNHTSYVIVKA